MPVTLDLPPEAKARLEAEAARRGISLDQLVTELSNQFAGSGSASAGDALRKFFGCGDSGDPKWATTDIHELRHEMARRSSEIVQPSVLLVDTNVWLSAADEGSERNADSVAVLAAHEGELAATVPVIAETSWLILDRLGPDAQRDFIELITSGAIERVDLIQEDWERVVELCGRYADMRLDVVDASVIAVAERLGLDTVATYNHRDFRVVRPRHVEAFQLLP